MILHYIIQKGGKENYNEWFEGLNYDWLPNWEISQKRKEKKRKKGDENYKIMGIFEGKDKRGMISILRTLVLGIIITNDLFIVRKQCDIIASWA